MISNCFSRTAPCTNRLKICFVCKNLLKRIVTNRPSWEIICFLKIKSASLWTLVSCSWESGVDRFWKKRLVDRRCTFILLSCVVEKSEGEITGEPGSWHAVVRYLWRAKRRLVAPAVSWCSPVKSRRSTLSIISEQFLACITADPDAQFLPHFSANFSVRLISSKEMLSYSFDGSLSLWKVLKIRRMWEIKNMTSWYIRISVRCISMDYPPWTFNV